MPVAKRRRRKSRCGFRFSIATETTCSRVTLWATRFALGLLFSWSPAEFRNDSDGRHRTYGRGMICFFVSYLPTPTGCPCARVIVLDVEKQETTRLHGRARLRRANFVFGVTCVLTTRRPFRSVRFVRPRKAPRKKKTLRRSDAPLISIYCFVSTRTVETETGGNTSRAHATFCEALKLIQLV